MKAKLLAAFLLAGGSLFAAPRVFLGVGVGYAGGYYAPPPPPPPVVAYAAPVARPGYVFIDGYWYPAGARYGWHPGYYARRPFAGAVWVGPRYYGGRYYRGYWRR
ncbi:MAG TPA: hypothetical protein VHZ07_08630 [Bryobacteraceae bacterium]|nr:hypothetical protein [Bryobacteraceae bacterium]